jgi:hypothetical protein
MAGSPLFLPGHLQSTPRIAAAGLQASAAQRGRDQPRLALRRSRHSTALDGPKNIRINNMSGGVMKNDNTAVPKYPKRRLRPKYPTIKHRST